MKTKEITKVNALLDQKEKTKAETVAKLEKELQDSHSKLAALKEQLSKSDSAEQYKSLLQEIRDYEAVIEFCEHKLIKAKTETLTGEEYTTLKGSVTSAFEAIKKEQGAAINAEIDKLVSMLEAYDKDVTELNALSVRINSLGSKNNAVTTLNAQTISETKPDYRYFIEAYYRYKTVTYIQKRQNGA